MNLKSIEDEIHSWIDSVESSLKNSMWNYVCIYRSYSVCDPVYSFVENSVRDSVYIRIQRPIIEELKRR
jgi:hypothetical protein